MQTDAFPGLYVNHRSTAGHKSGSESRKVVGDKDMVPQKERYALCVAAPDLSSPSETFIRDHIDQIAPRDSIVALLGGSHGLHDFPILRIHRPPTRTGLAGKLKPVFNLFARGCLAPIPNAEASRCVAYLKDHGVKVILAEYGPTGAVLKDVARRADIPMFVHFHGWDASYALRNWKYRLQYRILSNRAERFICPSEALRTNLTRIGIPKSKIVVVPYGVDVERFSPVDGREKQLLVNVGRFVEKKSPQTTLRSFAAIHKEFPQARIEMIGAGRLLEQCKTLTHTLGISEKVVFHGAQPHSVVEAKLKEAMLYVQHSVTAPTGDTEGMPVSILEAMAAGLPVIATRHAGIPEIVADGESGLLVREGAIGEMADAMRVILKNDDLRRKMGQRARERILREFSRDIQLKNLRSLLNLPTPKG